MGHAAEIRGAMSLRVSIVMVIVVLGFLGAAQAAAKKSLAILEITGGPTVNTTTEERRILTDAVRTQALRSLPTAHWDVLPREKVNGLIPKKTPVCEEACVARLVRKKASDYVVSGALAAIGSTFQVTLTAYRTESRTLEASEVFRAQKIEELVDALDQRSADMFRKIALEAANNREPVVVTENRIPFSGPFAALGVNGSLPVGTMRELYGPGGGIDLSVGLRFGRDFGFDVYGISGVTAYKVDHDATPDFKGELVEIPARGGASVFVSPFFVFGEAGPHYFRESLGDNVKRWNSGYGGALGGGVKFANLGIYARARVQNIKYFSDTRLYEAGLRWYTGR